MSFWDEQFGRAGFKYGTAPNAFLVTQEPRFPRGARVLVPGDGEGRNGAWLAGQGHRVTSLDQSAVGLAKARALAAERGVALGTLQADLSTWAPEPGTWDAVVLTYVHLPPDIRAAAHRHLARGLAPGGVLVLEAFHPRQRTRGTFGPKDAAMLYTLEMLRADLTDPAAGPLVEAVAWEGEVLLDEGPGHAGPGDVVRWVGTRAG